MLDRIVELRIPESEQLDFKLQMPKDEDLCRDVAAMANHLGGLLLIGVDEQELGEKTGAACAVPGDSLLVGREAVRDWISKAVAGRVVPRIEVAVREIPTGSQGKGVIAIGVPRGAAAPYASDLRGGKFWFQRRRGTHNGEFSEAEIAAAFSERSRRAERRRDRLVSLVAGWDRLSAQTGGPLFEVVVVPEIAGSQSLAHDSLDQGRSWFQGLRTENRLIDRWQPDYPVVRAVRDGVVVSLGDIDGYTFYTDGSIVSMQGVPDVHALPSPTGALLIDELTMLGRVAWVLRVAALHAVSNCGTGGMAEVAFHLSSKDHLQLCEFVLNNQPRRIGEPIVPNPVHLTVDLDAIAQRESVALQSASLVLTALGQDAGQPMCTFSGPDLLPRFDKWPTGLRLELESLFAN